MIDDDIIKNYVINKLGCNCPPEVFRVIKCYKNVQINHNLLLNYKINIGNRLLIYIIEIGDANFLNNNLSKVIKLGIKERDENNFNRFRLVIISDDIGEIGLIAQNTFNNLINNDPKVHLHVLEKADILI